MSNQKFQAWLVFMLQAVTDVLDLALAQASDLDAMLNLVLFLAQPVSAEGTRASQLKPSLNDRAEESSTAGTIILGNVSRCLPT